MNIALRDKLVAYNKAHQTQLTARELRQLYEHIFNEALEYFLDTVEWESYVASLIDDQRSGRD